MWGVGGTDVCMCACVCAYEMCHCYGHVGVQVGVFMGTVAIMSLLWVPYLMYVFVMGAVSNVCLCYGCSIYCMFLLWVQYLLYVFVVCMYMYMPVSSQCAQCWYVPDGSPSSVYVVPAGLDHQILHTHSHTHF